MCEHWNISTIAPSVLSSSSRRRPLAIVATVALFVATGVRLCIALPRVFFLESDPAPGVTVVWLAAALVVFAALAVVRLFVEGRGRRWFVPAMLALLVVAHVGASAHATVVTRAQASNERTDRRVELERFAAPQDARLLTQNDTTRVWSIGAAPDATCRALGVAVLDPAERGETAMCATALASITGSVDLTLTVFAAPTPDGGSLVEVHASTVHGG